MQKNYSLSSTFWHALVVSKIYLFAFYYIMTCMIFTLSLRLLSVVRLSEEAGIQCLGPDNVAIWKVRYSSLTVSIGISLLLFNNISSFQLLFHPELNPIQVRVSWKQNSFSIIFKAIGIRWPFYIIVIKGLFQFNSKKFY